MLWRTMEWYFACGLQLTLLVLLHGGSIRADGFAVATRATQQAPAQNSYFFMDGSGSYRYNFDTGNGIEGAQSANPANEVTGHYTYHDDKGIPYMVRYRAGVQGYQPEMLATAPVVSVGKAGSLLQQQHVLHATLAGAVANSVISHSKSNNGGSGGSSSGGTSSQQPTFQFVQNALRTMQTQPLRLSFNSMHHSSNLQHATSAAVVGGGATAVKPATAVSASTGGIAAVASLIDKPQARPKPNVFGAAYKVAPLATGFEQLNNNKFSFAVNSNKNENIGKSNSYSISSSSTKINTGSTNSHAGGSAKRKGHAHSVIVTTSPNNNPQRLTAATLHPSTVALPHLHFISHLLPSQSLFTPQLLVRLSHLPHSSYNYKVDTLHNKSVLSSALHALNKHKAHA